MLPKVRKSRRVLGNINHTPQRSARLALLQVPHVHVTDSRVGANPVSERNQVIPKLERRQPDMHTGDGRAMERDEDEVRENDKMKVVVGDLFSAQRVVFQVSWKNCFCYS